MPKQSRPLCYLDDEYEHRSVNVKDAKAKARSSDHSDKATAPAVVNKKRRLGRACTFCQRSHLVCEEERPCQRCVRRGIADECVRDDEDYAARRASKSKKSTSSSRMADPATERRTAPDPVAHDAMPWDEALFSSFFYDQDLSRALLDTTAPSLLTAPLTIDRACEAMFAGTLAAQQSPLQPPPPTNTNGNGKRSTPLRQRVKWFEPLPFRKGYASILRHLQDQRWQDANIASVQQALASVCALWYRREDVMQLSDLIQVQAQWATNLTTYRDHVLPHSPIAMLACRKAGEIYGANEPALKLLKRPATDFEDGVLSVYQMMTEQSAAQFFRLYERAIREKTAEVDEPASSNGKDQGSTVTLYWNADLIVESHEIDDPVTIHTRGVFHIKFSNLELPVSAFF